LTVTENWRNQYGKKGPIKIKADVYDRLADHYRGLGQPPQQEGLEDLLEEIFTPLEAEVLLALPHVAIPLQTVAVEDVIDKVGIARQELRLHLSRKQYRLVPFQGHIHNREEVRETNGKEVTYSLLFGDWKHRGDGQGNS
jgi:hypothetical protein